MAAGDAAQLAADVEIRNNAAAQKDAFRLGFFNGKLELAGQTVGDGFLERGGQVVGEI